MTVISAASPFNGGPGTCPAKPGSPPPPPPPPQSFNGGPGTCPAKRVELHNDAVHALLPSMEGRARARPNKGQAAAYMRGTKGLQWRAGHVPGQTPGLRRRPRPVPPTFNGGPGTCPAKPPGAPSSTPRRPRLQWRAGHVPGQTRGDSMTDIGPACLQWRAGHVPGQTPTSPATASHASAAFNGGPGTCPAKRSTPRPARRCRRSTFNGGPGTCPAKPGHRAGESRPPASFNGGPGTCPAKPLA